jgi:hypothetical protein
MNRTPVDDLAFFRRYAAAPIPFPSLSKIVDCEASQKPMRAKETADSHWHDFWPPARGEAHTPACHVPLTACEANQSIEVIKPANQYLCIIFFLPMVLA